MHQQLLFLIFKCHMCRFNIYTFTFCIVIFMNVYTLYTCTLVRTVHSAASHWRTQCDSSQQFKSHPVHLPMQWVAAPSIVNEWRKACIYSTVLTVVRSVAFSQSAQSCLCGCLSLSLSVYLSVALSLFSLRSLLWTHTHTPRQTHTPLCYAALLNELLWARDWYGESERER